MEMYANRDKEYNQILKLLEMQTQAIFINSSKASGISSFLKTRLESELQELNYLTIRINAESIPTLADAILKYIIKDSELSRRMQDCFNQNYGLKEETFIEKASLSIPYIGNILSYIIKNKVAAPIYTGDFSSAMEEILTIFFASIKYTRCVIIIDSSQCIIEDSYGIINDLIRYNSVSFIFAITEKNDHYLKLYNFIRVKEFKLAEIDFPEPYAELVIKIGELYNIRMSKNTAIQIVDSSNHNIHRILSTIIQKDYSALLSAWDKAIVRILFAYKNGLSTNDLFDILKNCGVFSVHPQQTLNDSLAKLLSLHIVEIFEDEYTINYSSHPEILNIAESLPQQLLYKSAIIKHFKSVDYISKIDAITLYRLAEELEDGSLKRFARIKIKHFLVDGTSIDKSTLSNASFNLSSQNDCIVCSIIYARKKRYQEALDWLKNTNVESNIYIKTLYGILLNRVRDHLHAEKVLQECLENTECIENKVIIISYLISNYIHQEKLDDARSIYESAIIEYKDAKNLGYLIRNAISAFSGYQEDMYKIALRIFKENNDMFGYYSTLCNQGYRMLSIDKVQALKILSDALDYIKLYGDNISNIALNNLGIGYTFFNRFDEARECFQCIINSDEYNMPSLFASINLAFCNAVSGNKNKAYHDIRNLQMLIDRHPLDRVRQKYYINRLLIEYICLGQIDNSIVIKAKHYSDRYNPEKVEETIAYIKRNPRNKDIPNEVSFRLYSPCGLAYWFINPLKIFPEGFLDDIITI